MALNTFLSMGSSIKLNWMGLPLTGVFQPMGAYTLSVVVVMTQQAWALAPWQIQAH